MKKFTILFMLLFLIQHLPLLSKDGLQGANWIFGENAWLDFTTGNPVSRFGANLFTHEGCGSISDKDGNLLFYTDGASVRNRNHEIMPHGANLAGSYNRYATSQSGLIIPWPGHPNKYYMIIIDYLWPKEGQNYEGLSYYIVDMQEDNGLGAVVDSVISFIPKSCEKVTAVQHSNGKDFWIATQLWDENIIEIFLLDETGIHSIHKHKVNIFPNFNNVANTKGCMKFSPNGSKLASANNGVGLFIYDFDNSTGMISSTPISFTNGLFKVSYGIEFSPEANFLYLSCSRMGGVSTTNGTPDNAWLAQLDMNAGSADDITNELVILEQRGNNKDGGSMGALQIGLDGNIYFAYKATTTSIYSNFLGVIQKPEEKGMSCNYIKEGIMLNYGKSITGLPQSVQSFYYEPEIDVIADDCEGGIIQLIANEEHGYSYRWKGPNDFEVEQANYTIDPATRNHSGRYTLFITNHETSEVTTHVFDVEIKWVDIEISVSEVLSTEEQSKSIDYFFTIENKSSYPVTIKSVSLKDGTKCFLNSVSTPLNIDAFGTSTNDVSCYLYSSTLGEFDDELILEITEPCNANESFYFDYYIGAFDPIIIYVHLPDTVAHVNETIQLPLKARVTELPEEGTKFNLKITWHYLANVYYAFPNQAFKMDSPYLDSLSRKNEYITAYFDDVELDTIYKTIAYVNGYALLDSAYYTPLEFDDDKKHSDVDVFGYIIVGEDGSITTQAPACLSRDIVMNPYLSHNLTVLPTPLDRDGTIRICSSDKGNLTLSIYSLTGEIMETLTFNNTDKFSQEVPFETSQYPSGTYFLVWQSSKNIFRKTIMIAE